MLELINKCHISHNSQFFVVNTLIGTAIFQLITVILCIVKFVGGTKIKSLTGEPNYKSVYLTWFVENDENATDILPRSNGFSIHYCELQTWGSHRCKTKMLKDNNDHVDK
ncbi:hypothetical protein HA402_009292 [Bradysia odoriphaga]|nr:hypothetical protein HA402_009292 [Bradysia odoriphaga]